MRLYFTEEDEHTRIRAVEIRAALVHARHDVVHGTPDAPPPPGTDVWFHGLGAYGRVRGLDGPSPPPMDTALVDRLLASNTAVVVFQLCDGENMSFERIPPALGAKVGCFLRNHWPADTNAIPAAYRDRIGWLPPMLRMMRARAGKPLALRSQCVFFMGARTGFDNLGEGRNARETLVSLMRESGLPFVGGLTGHDDPRYQIVVPKNRIERMHKHRHQRLLRDARICLAPWGNHPVTYRFFEGLAYRCLVVAQSLDSTRTLDGGLTAGVHYVRVAPDLGDLVDVVRHYLERPDDAQRIADAGHAAYRRCFSSRGPLLSKWLFEASVATWNDLYRPSDRHGPDTWMRALAARVAPRRL